MFMRGAHLLLLGVLCAAATAYGQPAPTSAASTTPNNKWPTQDGNISLPNFRFGTGETLPELKLHYLTLGTPHRNAAGHVDNAVLLLHGTGGNAHSLLNPVFSDVLFVPGGIARYPEILHYSAGRHRARAEFEAFGRHAHALPCLRLRRHGAQPADDARPDEGRSSAADSGNVDGLHADVCVGRDVSRTLRMRWRRLRACRCRLRGATA